MDVSIPSVPTIMVNVLKYIIPNLRIVVPGHSGAALLLWPRLPVFIEPITSHDINEIPFFSLRKCETESLEVVFHFQWLLTDTMGLIIRSGKSCLGFDKLVVLSVLAYPV